MDKLEKAQKNLEGKDIPSKIQNDTLYVYVNDTMLQLAQYEIEYQANEYAENN